MIIIWFRQNFWY